MIILVFYLREARTMEAITYFSENIFEKNLIEKWLKFYTYQLKIDLSDEVQIVLNKLDSAQQKNQMIKTTMSIIDASQAVKTKERNSNSSSEPGKKINSKQILDSIKMLLLLVNKISRISQPTQKSSATGSSLSNNTKTRQFLDKINMKRVKLDVVFNHLFVSIQEIINHFIYLNQVMMEVQQEQESMIISDPVIKMLSKKSKLNGNDYVTLKQSNEIVKQFHSIADTLMILVTSIKDM